MRLREWTERGRITTPPPVLPILVVGLVAMLVAHVALVWLGGLGVLVWALFAHTEVFGDWRVWGAVLGEVLLAPVVFIGWWAVRLLVGVWVRNQPPDPPHG